jgi:hypothetical protein
LYRQFTRNTQKPELVLGQILSSEDGDWWGGECDSYRDWYAEVGVSPGGLGMLASNNFDDRIISTSGGWPFCPALLFPAESYVSWPFVFEIPRVLNSATNPTPLQNAGIVEVAISLWDSDSDRALDKGDDLAKVGVYPNPNPNAGSGDEIGTLGLYVDMGNASWRDATIGWDPDGPTVSPKQTPAGFDGGVNGSPGCTSTEGADTVICFKIDVDGLDGDTDGDGVTDVWEAYGYSESPFPNRGVVSLGSDWKRKDIFVEVDCLADDRNGDGDYDDPVDHSHCPTQDAMQDVVQAFANAPVLNLDGTTGIQLHLDTDNLYGDQIISVPGTGGVTGSYGALPHHTLIHSQEGPQISEVGNTIVDWDGNVGFPGTNFYDLRTQYFHDPPEFYRYAIFVHQIVHEKDPENDPGEFAIDCTSGWAEGILSNDFLVSLGGQRDVNGDGVGDGPCWGDSGPNGIDEDGDGRVDEDLYDGFDNDGDCPGDTNGDDAICWYGDLGVDEDGGFSVGNREQQAGTFMHELGHTLGLHHGGLDNDNLKPNYLSLMNYSFQDCSVPSVPTADLPGGCDFSRVALPPVTELLDERSLDECQGIGVPVHGQLARDWNRINGLEGQTCPSPNTLNIVYNINRDKVIGELRGFEDWNSLEYNFRTSD